MYLKLRRGELRKIVSKAIKKAGTIYKLQDEIKISRSALSDYHNEKRMIREDNLGKLTEYLEIDKSNLKITEKLPLNWKQVKGGKKCVESKKKKGSFQTSLIKARAKQSEKLREWHEGMKKYFPEEYHKIQYLRFKKVGNYKLKTKRGEKVRNLLEKRTADALFDLKINYEYEPLVKAASKYFFPDFLINNKVILECTEWRGKEKATKLKEKIKHLKKEYKVFVVIPKHLNNYYKILNNHLLLVDENDPVAQTFRSLKG